MGLTPVLRVEEGEVPKRALVVGDPARAEAVAERLDGARLLGRFREYVTFAGEYRGKPVAVSSHGVGAPGAAICFEELYQAGARRIIRAGTCGGLNPAVEDGHLVIATGAVREDGVTQKLVPLSYPAIAYGPVVDSLIRATAKTNAPYHVAPVLTHSLFYPGELLGGDLQLWQRAGVFAVEMECAALFVLGALHNIQTGAILAVDGNPLRPGEGKYNPHRTVVRQAVEAMVGVALDALTLE